MATKVTTFIYFTNCHDKTFTNPPTFIWSWFGKPCLYISATINRDKLGVQRDCNHLSLNFNSLCDWILLEIHYNSFKKMVWDARFELARPTKAYKILSLVCTTNTTNPTLFGRSCWIRTSDTRIKSAMLYQLS